MATIYAGIITYNSDTERLKQNIGAVFPQVKGLVIVDNGSDNISEIRRLVKKFDDDNSDGKIFLIENSKNLGVAKALNQIMSESASKGKADWVLTLDDDTVVYDNIIAMYEPYLELSLNKSIHPASLTCLRRDRNYAEKNNNGSKTDMGNGKMPEYEFVHTCITSGNLLSVSAWKAVGGFDERLFIDMVDDEFCLRLEENDYDIIRVNSYGYLHEMGNNLIKVSFLGKSKTIFAYSEMRKYYTARNITYINRRYRAILRGNKSYTRYLWKRIIGTILYEKNKIKGLRAYIKGIREGKKMC